MKPIFRMYATASATMLTACLSVVFLASAGRAQTSPVISYLIPDIGTPDMNTYVEIIGPYSVKGNFGSDGMYLNNPGDAIQVVCANPSDSQYVRFGPCVVSWNGKMISTQAFVLPWVQAPSAAWQAGIKLQVRVLVGGVPSNVDTFYIVKPQTLGTLTAPGLLGSGGAYGTRSRRGAMIVDSMILTGNGTYGVSITDCDPNTPGNQGYLPFVLISAASIRTGANATIYVSATGVDAGPGGGGGGDGLICGTIGGNGFTGGGGNADWTSGCGALPSGIGTGQNQNGLNAVPGGVSSGQNEGGGGGTGHPFGIGGGPGGENAFSGGGPPGFGGGSGGPQYGTPPRQGGGGGAGYVLNGIDGGAWASVHSGGQSYGNVSIIPLAGGSGGGGGNVNSSVGSGAGSGGGGGGAVAMYGRMSSIFGPLISSGGDGDSSANNGAGGGGSGGSILCGSKMSASFASVHLDGGMGGKGFPIGQAQDGGNSSPGRLRIDGPEQTPPNVLPTGARGASDYKGPSTDTQSYVSRTFILTGTANGKVVNIYIRPLSSAWYQAAAVSNYGTSWSTSITLPGTDTIYLLAAAQSVPSPSSAPYASDPSWVLSQSAANILRTDCRPPVAAITSNKPPILCVGDSVTLSASPSGFHYQWLKNNQTLPVTDDSLTVSDSGIYSVIVSNAAGCSDSTAVSVSITPALVADISGPRSICLGSSTILSASPAGFDYEWQKNGQTLPVSDDSLTVSDSGIYSVIVSNGGACSDSTSVHVIVNPAPVAGISGPRSFCAGSSAILSASPGGLSYQWMKNGQQLVSTDSLIVTDSGDYSIVVSNTSGCSDSATVHVAINPLPVATIIAPDTIICAGSSTTLMASGGKSYRWSDGETTSSIVVSDAGNYFVTLTDSNGCFASSNSVAVVVDAPPQPEILPKSIPLICAGERDTLYTSLPGLNTEWLDNNSIVVDTRDTLITGDYGRYIIRATDRNGCSSVSAPAQVAVQETPPLQVAVVPTHGIAGSKVQLVISLGESKPPLLLDSLRFVLHFNNDLLSPGSLVAADCFGSLIKFTSLNRIDKNTMVCSIVFTRPVALDLDSSCPMATLIAEADMTDTLNTSVSVDSLFADAGSGMMSLSICNAPVPEFNLDPECGDSLLLRLLTGKTLLIDGIIPNPSSDEFTITFTKPSNTPTHYEIDDVLGRTLTSGETSESQLSLSAYDLPEGVLLLRAETNGFLQTRRFVVVK